MGLSTTHLLILLAIIILIFGTKKLSNMGSDIGKAVKGFKDGVKGEEDKSSLQAGASPQVIDKTTIDVDMKEKTKS